MCSILVFPFISPNTLDHTKSWGIFVEWHGGVVTNVLLYLVQAPTQPQSPLGNLRLGILFQHNLPYRGVVMLKGREVPCKSLRVPWRKNRRQI